MAQSRDAGHVGILQISLHVQLDTPLTHALQCFVPGAWTLIGQQGASCQHEQRRVCPCMQWDAWHCEQRDAALEMLEHDVHKFCRDGDGANLEAASSTLSFAHACCWHEVSHIRRMGFEQKLQNYVLTR